MKGAEKVVKNNFLQVLNSFDCDTGAKNAVSSLKNLDFQWRDKSRAVAPFRTFGLTEIMMRGKISDLFFKISPQSCCF